MQALKAVQPHAMMHPGVTAGRGLMEEQALQAAQAEQAAASQAYLSPVVAKEW